MANGKMSKYIKTTKGIYELNENRKVEYIKIKTTSKAQLFDYSKIDIVGIAKYLGEVVAQSDNADNLIDVVYRIDKDEKGKYSYGLKPTSLEIRKMKDLINRYGRRIIGLTWIGDDLVKVADWDNEKGEWKLYER